MFRKVQLKFFAIITSILIAIFIALLSGINIIMDVLLERQTRIVLEQVAGGVEYNGITNTFSFTNPHMGRMEKYIPVIETTEEATSSSSPETAETTATAEQNATSVTAAETQTETQKATEAIQETEADGQEEEEQAQEEEEITEAQETEQPTEIPTEEQTEEMKPDFPPEDWGDRPQIPDSWRDEREKPFDRENHENWWEHEQQFPPEVPEHHDREIWGEGGFSPVADKDFAPVLDGYTIIDDLPPEKPDEKFDSAPVPKSFDSVDFFVIMADPNGDYLASLHNDDMTKVVAQNYITRILDSKEVSGMADNYSYFTEPKKNGTVMILSDRTAEINMMKKLQRTTSIIGIISIVFLSVGSYFISGLIVRPLKETFEKQKQFISDASHELKTPLTVISANADVLSGEIGENKWLNYIQDQTSRMNVLVNDLLSLTRLENKSSNFVQTSFNLSQAVTNTALPFECQAFETNKNFVLNIEENIFVFGSEQHIKQMVGIFIDNALKYSKDCGTVRVSLTKEDGKAVLSVYNTGTGVKEEDKYKIFERFYRSDESRNRTTGGYGLGLAIAKSIIDKHKFRIDVENEEGRSICFIVTM